MRLFQRKYFSETLKFKPLNQKGVVLPLVLSYALVFVMEIAALSQYASSTSRQVRAQENYLKTFYVAETAAEMGVARIRLALTKTGSIPANLNTLAAQPNVGGNFTFNDASNNSTYSITYPNGTSWQSKKLTVGNYTGLNSKVQTASPRVPPPRTLPRPLR